MTQFHHRAYHGSTVVGDYLYIDGGEITTWDGSGNGSQPLDNFAILTVPGNIRSVPENRTYSIDLRTSWTNETVILNSIFKDAAPIYNSAVLWPDASEKSLYSYDGGYSYTIDIVNLTTNELWQSTPVDAGGSWSQVPTPALSNFSDLNRVQAGIYGYGNGLGFSLGGRQSGKTNSVLPAGEVIETSGLVIYNTMSNEWFNLSSTGYSSNGGAAKGSAQFVPQFGKQGLLFILGGEANEPDSYVPFDVISMWDMESQQWAVQTATGTPPSPSTNLCAVGVPGDNGTYEIFVYGGFQETGDFSTRTQVTLASGAVHVLTLPAFHWMKQSSPLTFARYLHRCNVVGNRQMAVVGGVPVTRASTTEAIPPDPWPNGIGVFDLTEMNWVDHYDPDAPDYQTPEMVKGYYQKNSRYPEWSTPEIREWFLDREANNTQGESSKLGGSNSSGPNIGAIAGGTVGGVLCLLGIGLLFWFIYRQRRSARMRNAERMQPSLREAHAADGAQRFEMDPKERPYESGGSTIHELPQPAHELSAQGRM